MDLRACATADAEFHRLMRRVRGDDSCRVPQQGVGTAMTAAALAVAPDRPAVVSASPEGCPVYRRLGFVDVGGGVV